MVAPSLTQYHADTYVRGQHLDAPLLTVDTSNRYGMTATFLSEWYGKAAGGIGLDSPMRTVTMRDHEALTVATLQVCHAGGYSGKGKRPDDPLNTVTAVGAISMIASSIIKFKGDNLGQVADAPLQTVTAQSAGGGFGVLLTRVEKYCSMADMQRWPEVRAMLNEHCGYTLAEDEVLLLQIGGAWWFIADIGLRMLTPREAFSAQGFPLDYIIDVNDMGKPYPKSEQMARCGNAVCPPAAAALVRANHPYRRPE